MSILSEVLEAIGGIEAVNKSVSGELFEANTDQWSAFYGNGELIIYPDPNSNDPDVYTVNNVRGFDELVRD